MMHFTKIVQNLPSTVPFVGPETQERALGRGFAARLGANESVFGPAPSVIAAMGEAAPGAWQYGDPESYDLKQALAQHHGIPPEAIVIGAGIDGLLNSLVRLIVAPGVDVVTSDGAYPTFNYHVTGYGGTLHKVPYADDAEDPVALVRAVQTLNAPLVYFANPDNPMGSWHSADVVEGMIEQLPRDTVLCLDEAYCEFAPAGSIPPLDLSRPNVIRMRTFSKAYGLAGMRIGYAIGHPDLIAAFNKVRNHFGVSRVSQAAALAALADQDWLNTVLGQVNASKQRIAGIGRANGLTVLPSATNFVTLDCGRDGDYARALVQALAHRGVFIRMPFVAPQDRCIRVSAGTSADLDVLETVLPQVLAGL